MTTIYYNYYTSSSLFHGSLLSIMGTRLDLVMIVESLVTGVRIWDKLVDKLENLDHILNRFSNDSEISKLNATASITPVPVSDELWDIICDCKEYYRMTQGLFDVTLRNFEMVEFDKEKKTIFFKNNQISFDFGGFAKGYAIEKLKEIILNAKISQAFINFGNSSVCCIGTHPYGDSWNVSIENPYNPEHILGTIYLKDSSLSVSGNTPDYNKHIVRPGTDKFVEDKKIVCVSTINAAVAEVLSTTLLLSTEKEKIIIKNRFKDFATYVENEYYAG